MKRIAQIISWLGLAATVLPACLYFANIMEFSKVKLSMIAGAILWFAAAPLYMEHRAKE
jgi:hypothetical protein